MHFVLLDPAEQHNEALARKILACCNKLDRHGCIALKTTDARAVAHYAATCTVPTVYFLSIELDHGQTSLPLHKVIQQSRAASYIIYLSARAQYAMECLHAHAFDFLLKPLSDPQLEECLAAVMGALAREEKACRLQVHTGGHTIMADPDQILYFSRDRMTIRLHALDGSTLEWRESFAHLLSRLAANHFFLCHRSFVVNLRKIQIIDWESDQIYLTDHTVIPVSRRRAAELKAALKRMETHAL